MKRHHLALALLVGASYSLGVSVGAAAATSITTVPALTSGRTYSANFSADHYRHGGPKYWSVRLLLGDDISLTAVHNKAADVVVKILPIGTDVAALRAKKPIYEAKLAAFPVFTAPGTGTYPVEILCAATTCGPTKFFVSITHQLDLEVPHATRLGMSGTFTVRVVTPQGRPVTSATVIIDLYGLWKENFTTLTHHVLGSAKPVHGRALVSFRLPNDLHGKTITLQATAAGGSYHAAASSFCQAHVR